MNSKHKHSPDALPDRQLAKAFDFTADDLAANQAGFVSWRQYGDWLTRLFAGKKRPQVASICGRAKLRHERRQVRWQFHLEYAEIFTVAFPSHQMRFALTAPQYKALCPNLVYRVYYREGRILSLERPVKGCEDG